MLKPALKLPVATLLCIRIQFRLVTVTMVKTTQAKSIAKRQESSLVSAKNPKRKSPPAVAVNTQRDYVSNMACNFRNTMKYRMSEECKKALSVWGA